MRKAILTGILVVLFFAPTVSSSGMAYRTPSVNARVIASHENSLKYAYESSFKTHANRRKVKAVVRFDITAPGDVESVEILALEGFDTVRPSLILIFADKIVEAVYTWRFPPIDEGTVTAEIPFVFVPVEKGPRNSADKETRLNKISFEDGRIVKEGEKEKHVFGERVIKCWRERAVYVEIPRSIPDGGIFEKAAKSEAEKPVREFLIDVGRYVDERREPSAASLSKNLARSERELAEVEAALAEEGLRTDVDNLGLSDAYDWKVKAPNVKEANKLREKRERLSAEIEKLSREISTAEETRSRSLADKRTALMVRGEGLPKESPPSGGDLWITLALAELYLDGGEAAKAATSFREVIENGEGEIVAEALYDLAQSYLVAGDEENAALAFLQLTAAEPNSPYVAESYFRLGEYCASISKPVEAGEYYSLAAASDGPYCDVARYRAAWTYYECSGPLGEEYYDRAVTTFKSFLDGADESSPYWDHAVEMTGLCLAEWEPDISVALNNYEEVFRGTDEQPYAPDVLRAMGDAYLYRMDRLPEAAATYEYLLEKYPSYDDAAAVITSIVESNLRREAYDGAHAASLRLVDEYRPASNWYWTQDESTRCQALLRWETALYEVAIYYNVLALRSERKPEGAAEADEFYRETLRRYDQYLITFPTNEKAYHVNFYFAETYYALGDFENAAQQYIKTAIYYTDRERYKIDKWDDRFTQEESYYSAVLSYAELFKANAGTGARSKVYEEELLNAREEFLKRYPESQETADLLSLMADAYFKDGDFEKARSNYIRIIEEYPKAYGHWYSREYDKHYVKVLIIIAMTYVKENEASGAAGEEGNAEYEAWLERARAEAEKRNVDFEEIIEEFE